MSIVSRLLGHLGPLLIHPAPYLQPPLGNMNRIAQTDDSNSLSLLSSSFDDSFDVATTVHNRFAREAATPHTTFAPMHYESGYAYPLVVWLHGPEANENQLRRVMPLISMRNYVGAAPRGTLIDRMEHGAYHWQQTASHIADAETRIFESIEAAEDRYHIHADRVFLVGYGDGGTMALRVAWNHPQKFAGVASIDGRIPRRFCPLRQINQVRQLPCLLATARESDAYPERQVCDDLRLLHSAGCTIALRQYPCSGDLTTAMLSDLDRWMMELVCASKKA